MRFVIAACIAILSSPVIAQEGVAGLKDSVKANGLVWALKKSENDCEKGGGSVAKDDPMFHRFCSCVAGAAMMVKLTSRSNRVTADIKAVHRECWQAFIPFPHPDKFPGE